MLAGSVSGTLATELDSGVRRIFYMLHVDSLSAHNFRSNIKTRIVDFNHDLCREKVSLEVRQRVNIKSLQVINHQTHPFKSSVRRPVGWRVARCSWCRSCEINLLIQQFMYHIHCLVQRLSCRRRNVQVERRIRRRCQCAVRVVLAPGSNV